jgi:hypothetical protein
MKYKKKFIQTVLDCKETKTYVGTGNPNSVILIVGKETATDVENKANRDELYVRFQIENLQDFKENAIKWDQNIKDDIDVNSIPNWVGGKDSPLTLNPFFPYKGLHPKELKEGQTWRKYQKLHDLIFINPLFSTNEKEFDFHNNFFLTEMNSSPAKYTKDAN